jgi:hypothetical protein
MHGTEESVDVADVRPIPVADRPAAVPQGTAAPASAPLSLPAPLSSAAIPRHAGLVCRCSITGVGQVRRLYWGDWPTPLRCGRNSLHPSAAPHAAR